MTTWMDKGIRDEVDMAQFAPSQAVPADLAPTTFAKLAMMFPDPRDARIAELEAALREIEHWCEIAIVPYLTLKAIRERAATALMQTPERDMQITHEELGA